MKNIKILMVCLGNICRSPLAEGIMVEKLHTHNLDISVDSAGTGAWHVGHPPDSRSIATAKKFGIDISKQRARKIANNDFGLFDLIFTMDADVHHDVIRLATTQEQKNKAFLLLQFAGNQQQHSVPDPYYGDLADFEEVFHILDKACDAVLNKLKDSWK